MALGSAGSRSKRVRISADCLHERTAWCRRAPVAGKLARLLRATLPLVTASLTAPPIGCTIGAIILASPWRALAAGVTAFVGFAGAVGVTRPDDVPGANMGPLQSYRS